MSGTVNRVTTLRIQFVGHGPSLLPEDRVVNTFHFHNAGVTYPTGRDACVAAVAAFYNGVFAGDQLGAHISAWVQRDAELRIYNLEDPPGARVPIINGLTLSGAVGGGLPEEVAIVLSLRGAPPVNGRRRGRLYIGPLSNGTNTYVAASVSTPARPNMSAAGIAQQLVNRANALEDAAVAANVPWCIRSTVPSENFVPIVDGFVDNAFDTQRRRGPDTTARIEWA